MASQTQVYCMASQAPVSHAVFIAGLLWFIVWPLMVCVSAGASQSLIYCRGLIGLSGLVQYWGLFWPLRLWASRGDFLGLSGSVHGPLLASQALGQKWGLSGSSSVQGPLILGCSASSGAARYQLAPLPRVAPPLLASPPGSARY